MEAAGLGCQLTEAVLLRAFDDWDAERLETLDLALAFNFPVDVLLLSDALTYLDTLRIEAGIAAGRVVIELTESSPLPASRNSARPPAGCVRSATASRSTMSAPTCATTAT